MNYQKLKLGSTNIHLIKTKKFKTISIKINFRRPINKKEVTIRNLLAHVLIESTKKYPTRRSLEIKTEELYNVGIGVDTVKSGRVNIMSFSSTFLNEKFTEKGMIKESINFLKDIILKPNVIKNEFTKESFLLAKRIVKNEIESVKDSPGVYAGIRLLEEINSNNPISYRSCGYMEDLEKITIKSLYDYYKDVISNDLIDIFIVGDIDDDIINNFKEFKTNHETAINHYAYESEVEAPNYCVEKLPIKESILKMAFSFSNLTDYELKYVMHLYSFILGGSGDSKLFSTVREKESLCYYINSSYSVITGLLTVSAGINGENYDKTIKLIEKEMNKMKQGKFKEEDINNGKKLTENSYTSLFDSPKSIMDIYISSEYIKTAMIEERIENFKKVTKNDIVELAKKIKLHTVFFLEGDKNE